MQKPLTLAPLAVQILFALFLSNLVVNATGETNDHDHNRQIRQFLAGYVDDENGAKSTLERADPPTEELVVKISIGNTTRLIKKVSWEFVTERMKAECQKQGVHFSVFHIREDLARFQKNFHELTGGERLNNDTDTVQVLKLLLSLAIQMGYTVGSRTLGLLENEELSQLLRLHTCMEHIGTSGMTSKEKLETINVYLEAQFEYVEREKVLSIQFGQQSNNKEKRKTNFRMLKTVSGERKKSIDVTMGLLDYMDKKAQTEQFLIEDDDFFFHSGIDKNMKRLLEVWSEDTKMFKGNVAFYLLKRFVHDLSQRLLEEKQLQQGLFQMLPGVKDKLRELVAKFKDTKLDDEDKKALQHRTHMHFEELMPVKFGMEESIKNVSGANKMVTKWLKGLNGMNKETCAEVILEIFKGMKYFDTFTAHKLYRFDNDLNTALDTLSKEVGDDQLAKQIMCQEQLCLPLERKITSFKSDLEIETRAFEKEKGKIWKLWKWKSLESMETDLIAKEVTLKLMEAELTRANELLDQLRQTCMTQKDHLVEHVAPIVKVLMKLEANSCKIAKCPAVHFVEEAGVSGNTLGKD